MILTKLAKSKLLLSRSMALLHDIRKDPQRLNYIRNHTPMTQYDNLQPIIKQHLKNSVRLTEDKQTGIRFLIEEGGFSGCSDLGICIKLGIQNQNNQNSGSLQYLKSFVHMKPSFQELVNNYEFLNQTGSFFDFNYDALTSYAKCSFLEQDKNVMIDLLLDLAIQQKNMFQDNFQTEPDISNIHQLVRRTAFGNSGLGMPLMGSGNILTNKQFLNFQQNISPKNMLISMANVLQPDQTIRQILNRIKTKYPKFLQRKSPAEVKSKYVGGLGKFVSNQQFFEFAVAFPSAESKSQNMELFNILRILLGTASSFSSGGPGKGMHSRCTKNLLNKVACVQKASFINQHYEDTGLFGLTVGGPHDTYNEVINCTIQQLKRLKHKINDDELNRSKNILISSLYTNTQRQCDRLQQMSKHIYYYGRVRLYEFQQKIRQVTAQRIQKVINQMITCNKPTFVYSGNEQSMKNAPQQRALNQIYSKIMK